MKKYQIVLTIIFIFLPLKLISPQYQIDSLYLFPDTTKFNDQAIIVTGDITNLAVRFNTNWNNYEIFKIGVIIPSSILQIGPFDYNISTGE